MISDKILLSKIDASSSKLDNFLRYAYSDSLNIQSVDDAITTAYTSKKYALPHLLKQCVSYLQSNVNVDNVCQVYEFAQSVDAPMLIFACLNIIDKQTTEVLATAAFSRISTATAESIAKRSYVNVDSEYALYSAFYKWAERECNRRGLDPDDTDDMRRILRKILPHIRFLSMTPQEFAKGPAKDGLLTLTECVGVFMNLAVPKCVAIPPRINPNWNKRCAVQDGYFICRRFLPTSYAPLVQPLRVFGAQFSTLNKNVYLTGAAVPVRLDNIYSCLTSPSYSGLVRVIREGFDKSVVCQENNVTFQLQKGRDAVVSFTNPYYVKMGERYEVELVLHSPINKNVLVPMSRKKRQKEVSEEVIFQFTPFTRERLAAVFDVIEFPEIHFYC